MQHDLVGSLWPDLAGLLHLFECDSGYGSHFTQAAAVFGGFDLVVLDSGQYNEDWRYVHMMPEDAVQAAVQAAFDLKARARLLAHAGKFFISRHAWGEPYNRLVRASQKNQRSLLTAKIGELHALDAQQHSYTQWWKEIL